MSLIHATRAPVMDEAPSYYQSSHYLATVVPKHAQVLIEGLKRGNFHPEHMRSLVSVEQQWRQLAQLEPPCIEALSNIVINHLDQKAPLPTDVSPIGVACAAAHHAINNQAVRVQGQSNVHFQSYATMLVQLAQRTPLTPSWYEYVEHTINAATALGTHLDWVLAIQNETPRYRRGQRAPVRK